MFVFEQAGVYVKAQARGVLLMIGAVGCFPIMQSCVQALVTTHEMSFVQATWGRYFFHALLVPVFFPRVVTELRQLDGMQLTRRHRHGDHERDRIDDITRSTRHARGAPAPGHESVGA